MPTPRKVNCPACGNAPAADHYVGAGLYACNWDYVTPFDDDETDETEDEQV